MGYKQSLHVHSTYCDGKDSLEQMVQMAIRKGFDSIGFSGHSFLEIYSDFAMSPEKFEQYKAEIASLKEQYHDRIKIFCGIELDIYAQMDLTGVDYTIGSVHCMDLDGERLDFDRSAEVVKGLIDDYFSGDGYAYAEHYYKVLSTLPQYGNYDIIGHFDIITKHADRVCFFDQDAPRYRSAAIDAVHALAGKIPFFEVNTGAIARGYRKTPYPAPFILDEMREAGVEPIISSDCHNAEKLDCYYDEAAALLRAHGFRAHFVLKDSGFVPVDL